jgi:hypothetical protein
VLAGTGVRGGKGGGGIRCGCVRGGLGEGAGAGMGLANDGRAVSASVRSQTQRRTRYGAEGVGGMERISFVLRLRWG